MSVEMILPQDLDGKRKIQVEIEKYYAQVIYEIIDALEVDLKQKQELLEALQQLLLVSQKGLVR